MEWCKSGARERADCFMAGKIDEMNFACCKNIFYFYNSNKSIGSINSMRTGTNQAVEKFAYTSIWEFKRALEDALNMLGIEKSVAGVYDFNAAFLVAVHAEQRKAQAFLARQEKKTSRYDRKLCSAIRNHHPIQFQHNGNWMLIEPYVHGVDSEGREVIWGFALRDQPDETSEWVCIPTAEMNHRTPFIHHTFEPRDTQEPDPKVIKKVHHCKGKSYQSSLFP
jgi:hypothetical protein